MELTLRRGGPQFRRCRTGASPGRTHFRINGLCSRGYSSGRLVLATGVLLGAGLVWTERPQESFIVSVVVVFALVFTGYGAGTVFLLRRKPGNTFFLFQALVDLGLVTTVLHFAGQPQSAFPALYVLVVAGYSLLMPPAWVALTSILASVLFVGDTIWTHWRLPGYRVLGPDRRLQPGLRHRGHPGPPPARGRNGARDAGDRAAAGTPGGR